VNLQGDEPLIEPEAIEALVAAMSDPQVKMATLARPLEAGELERSHVVKVVTDIFGDALYFSRAPIPHRRAGGQSPLARAHVGIYGFTAAFLQEFAALPPGRLEGEEALEQLRALEHGHRIRVADTRYRGFGIDTPEDYAKLGFPTPDKDTRAPDLLMSAKDGMTPPTMPLPTNGLNGP
jgi:3-deoxy-manno-octulosonate cytidylyltransferase (CMP-KDO synthetase)